MTQKPQVLEVKYINNKLQCEVSKIMPIDPRELAKHNLEVITEEKQRTDKKAYKILWTAVSVNSCLGFVPVGINIWLFAGASIVMIVFLGKNYGLDLNSKSDERIIKQTFSKIGGILFMGILGVKFFIEALKNAGIMKMGHTTLVGGTLNAVLCGVVTYALGSTAKVMFKREREISNFEAKKRLKGNHYQGKGRVEKNKNKFK